MLVFRKAVFAALAFLIGAGAAASQSLEARLSVLVHEGRVAEAMAVFEASDPTDAQRLFFAGRLVKAGKNYQRAAELFAAALQADPTYLNARRELAHTLYLGKNYPAARHQFNQLLAIDSDPTLRRQYREILTKIAVVNPHQVGVIFAIVPSPMSIAAAANGLLTLILGGS